MISPRDIGSGITLGANILAVSLLTAILIAVWDGTIIGHGQMDFNVRLILYALVSAVATLVALIQGRVLDTADPFHIMVDTWTKLVGIAAAVAAAWQGLQGVGDLTVYLYLFVFLGLTVVVLLAGSAAHLWTNRRTPPGVKG